MQAVVYEFKRVLTDLLLHVCFIAIFGYTFSRTISTFSTCASYARNLASLATNKNSSQNSIDCVPLPVPAAGSEQVQHSEMGFVRIAMQKFGHIPAHAGACDTRTPPSHRPFERQLPGARYSWSSTHAYNRSAFSDNGPHSLRVRFLLAELRTDARSHRRPHQHLLRARASLHRCSPQNSIWCRRKWAGKRASRTIVAAIAEEARISTIH